MISAKHTGFSLIEILIALAISAVLSVILYRSFTQSNKLMLQVRDLIEENSETLSGYAQIEKDFAAAFLPVHEKVEKSSPTAQPTQPTQPQKPPQPAAKPAAAQEKPPEIIPFITTNADGKLATISFVTTNVLTVFNEAAPHLARVTYRFKKQASESATPLVTLVREEAPYDQKAELEKKQAEKKPTHAYELIRDISSWSANFSAFNCKKDGTKELVTFTNWGTDEQKKKAPDLTLPEFVELTLEVIEQRTQRATEMTIAVAVPAAHCQQCKVPEPKKAPSMPAAQGAAGQAKTAVQLGAATPPANKPINVQPTGSITITLQKQPAPGGQRPGVGSGTLLNKFMSGGK